MQISFSTDQSPATDGVIVYVVKGENYPAILESAITSAAGASRFEGKTGQLFETFVEREGKLVRVALAGAQKQDGDNSGFERAGAAVAAKYLTSGESTLRIDAAASGLDGEEACAVLVGLDLRSWRHDEYRTKLKDEQKVSLTTVTVHGAPSDAETLWTEAAAVNEGVKFTRELVAEPANKIYPETFVERCKERLKGTGAEIEVLDEAQMRELGMGALLGVSQGSARAPRMLVVRWNGGDAGDKPTVFVGKGVTFDSGGISIKPAAGMEDMKWDMGGAGAVAGAMLALAGRKAKANVIGICGLVENMPDGNAQRPGDVVTSMSGQTIEVINTDAEGRLVMCDAITWAQRNCEPKQLIDLATLTGAMLISLGHEQAGLFSNDDTLADGLFGAGKSSGDKVWRMPIGPAYDKLLDSPIADMKNVGPRVAGSITAAQFLQRFIEDDLPWAHLDIAGMAWADKAGATWDKGATGFGVRLIDRFVKDTLEG